MKSDLIFLNHIFSGALITKFKASGIPFVVTLQKILQLLQLSSGVNDNAADFIQKKKRKRVLKTS